MGDFYDAHLRIAEGMERGHPMSGDIMTSAPALLIVFLQPEAISHGLLWHRPVQEAKPVLSQMFFICYFRYDLPVGTKMRRRPWSIGR